MLNDIDTKETELHEKFPEAFNILLRDHTRFRKFKSDHTDMMTTEEIDAHVDDPCNLIIWATDDYEDLGPEYAFHEPITVDKVIDKNGMIIRPRCQKNEEEQTRRIKNKAEVFTPSWICNRQNNLVDEAWFGKSGIFNEEINNEDGTHTWISTTEPITDFPIGKTWKDYIRDTRLEITCGEAPYLCSRYDTTTGQAIPIKERIGLLDRKLRVISENCDKSADWLKMAQDAFKNTYGYEWQGDNLLLAREALLCSFIEFYQDKFNKLPLEKSINYIAYIISWNIWQMDGLKMVIPDTCCQQSEPSFFGSPLQEECQACKKGETTGHNGILCFIRDWRKPKGKQDITFSSLLNQ